MLLREIYDPPGDPSKKKLLTQSIPVSSLISKVKVTVCGPELTSILTLSISMLFKTGGSESAPPLDKALLFDLDLDCPLGWLSFSVSIALPSSTLAKRCCFNSLSLDIK